MMKKFLLLLVASISFSNIITAQSFAINTDGSTANASSLLDVKSTTKGLLIPRMSKTERTAITSPATGLLVFQNAPDSMGFYYFDGSVWNWLASVNGNADSLAWKRNGNAGTNPATHFIGTTDNQPLNFRQNNKWIGKFNSATNNYAVGAGAGENNTTGVNNVTIGDSAGNVSTSASHNVLIGTNAGLTNLGSWTTMIGIDAGPKNTANGSVFIGSAAGMKNSSGFGNTFVGDNAGREVTTSNNNTFFGSYTGQATTGGDNTAVGRTALFTNTTGTTNTAIGYNSLRSNSSANFNTAVGAYSLQTNNIGYENVAIGDYTLFSNTGGYRNTGVGSTALYRNNIGSANTALGFWSLYNNTSGFSNTAIGHVAGYSNDISGWQVAIGDSALFANTGNNHHANTAIGVHAGAYNPGSSGCIYIGFRSGYTSSGGFGNIFMGSYSGENNTGWNNIGIGQQALKFSTGGYNVALGAMALETSGSGSGNTAIGNGAIAQDTSGEHNTSLGAWSLYKTRFTSYNTVAGYQAMYNHRSGNSNTATGYGAMFSDTTGTQNVAVGNYAMRLYQGNYNTSVGAYTLEFLGTGTYNTILGYGSGVSKTNLSNASAIGALAFVDTSNAMVLGNLGVNVGIGITKPYQARLTVSGNTSANGHTIALFGPGQKGISIQQNNPTIGWNQFRDISAGWATRYMGTGFAWVNHMETTTGNMYWNSMPSGTGGTAGGTETVRMTLTNTGSLGLNVIPNGNGQLQFQNQLFNRRVVLWENANTDIDFYGFGINSGTLRYQVPTAGAGGNVHRFYAANTLLFTIYGNGDAALTGFLTTASDARLKKNITPVNYALDNLKKLKAYTYNWKDENKNKEQQIGLLAQEVENVYPQLIKKDSAGMMSVNYSGFVPLLIKSVQEQQQMIDTMQKRMDLLEEQNKKLWQMVKVKED